jgi:hypothetical protein
VSNSFAKIQNILQQYNRQQYKTKQLAKLRESMPQRPQQGDRVSLSQQGRRQQLVEDIAQEIIHNLLVSGSTNPMVQEVKAELESEVGRPLLFQFLPKENRLDVRKDNGERVSAEEEEHILQRLWDLTRQKVDETMI